MAQKMQKSLNFQSKNVILLFVDPSRKSYVLEGVSFEQHEEFQITLCLCVQFSEHVAKIYFLS